MTASASAVRERSRSLSRGASAGSRAGRESETLPAVARKTLEMTSRGRAAAMALLAALAALTLLRRVRPPEAPRPERLSAGGTWVEFEGAFDRPGLVRFAGPTSLGRALRA